MQYGYFDDDAREYVITRPDTPRPWSNYLGDTTYGAIVTNNGGGYSFYQSSARGRLTRLHFNHTPMDQPGRYLYLRDRDTSDYWSATWQPVAKPLDAYQSECRHGTAYTTVTSRYAEVESEITYFVPLGRHHECWMLKVTNHSDRPRNLSAFSFLEISNHPVVDQDTRNLQYSQYLVDCSFDGRFLNHGINTHLPDAYYRFFGLIGADVAGFDSDLDAFIGPYRAYSNPLAVETGACTGSLAHGDNGCGALQTDLTLAPGQSHEFMVLFGVGTADTAGQAAVAELPTVAAARDALDTLKAHWHTRLGAVVANTPDADLDHMVNVWNAYNSLITFAWSRAASLVYAGARDGLGYRDTVQDILGVLPMIPEEAHSRLELMITGQYSHGGAMPVVKPFEHCPGKQKLIPDDEHRGDDCLWLFNTVPAYVKETGDLAFLDRVLPYADQGEATVLGHLKQALQFNLDHRGAHGLPCGLLADWNDTLNLGPQGESLFLAFQLRFAFTTYVEICELRGQADEAVWAGEHLRQLDRDIDDHAWDGAWFVRAFSEDGEVIGSCRNEEGEIWLNAQSWAVLSGAATPEQARSAMDAVYKRLATPYGIALCDPPYRKTPVNTVRAALYNPSMKENAGIFCHPQSWAVIAETMLGRSERAYDYLRAYLPAAHNDRAEIRQIEPYVHAQSTHGKHSRRFGASRLPWLSGTVSWTYHTMTHYILGIRPDWDGLRIDPCIPPEWDGFRVRRQLRGATYDIVVKNPDGARKGVARLELDGKAVDPTRPLPPADSGRTVAVVATMG
ncbi:MAG: N,N'-diacetylchitobiose phosphorylase [Lentisphaerae bacterium]|jgi:N,N'-diacetylchitobiose phosphorylase|nr:N,N'-diacetylchitobiose phosphorylase [Lentisphaerota bacterium]MBT4822163.1 N,N'-diacetylchitobiose phosphorylase [Lentisphaerota bacterium]MBT5612452.1 N,N'-diacetylchitobiose phosphorylase [Lentisphaerota bacterium]MBT7057158.1 N,N'-diacetylchitobiose phosphorylase [Lentisphaerota bacterium]MBT7848032.1 N,N'-diacetylchitobiose phosphorylase [Lentisphaerota bacterium]